MAEEEEEDQPVSPFSRMMHLPCFNLCVLPVMGFATTIDVIYFKKCLEQTMVKFPRFSSNLVVKDEKSYNYRWKRTAVNVDDHVIVPDLDPDMESPDRFVEDYTARISKNAFDYTKPLWEVHVLNMETSDANSTVIFRIHHSIGDGVSLISLVLACSKKVSDPESLPVLPSKKKTDPPADGLTKRMFLLIWRMILMMYYTLSDFIEYTAMVMFMKDTESPLKGECGIEQSANRYVHRIVNMDDVKLIKDAMKVTINDVLLGVTEAGLCKYLEKRYEREMVNVVQVQKTNDIINNSRIRIAIAFNLRSSAAIEELAEVMEKGKMLEKGKWGNLVAGAIIRVRKFDDTLSYIRHVKTVMDRRKRSLYPKIQYTIQKQVVKFFGLKAAAEMTMDFARSTTLGFSNVAGPGEEIILFGHNLNYIAPTVSGFPQALVVHYQSYAKKLIVCLAADEKMIPNPQELCDCFQVSLEHMKDMVIKRGLTKDSI